jgi:cytochrome c-type protein NapB
MKKLIFSIIALATIINAAWGTEIKLDACYGCHGKGFERRALGKSNVVADMNATEIEKSLLGYKNDTYGGPMKALMKGQIAKYTDEDIKKISEKVACETCKNKR